MFDCRQEGTVPRRRDRLPPPAQQEKSVSLWSILKASIHKWMHVNIYTMRCLTLNEVRDISVNAIKFLVQEMVGKDLSRVCLPVYFNEPLSMLQKMPEDVEYSELIDKV